MSSPKKHHFVPQHHMRRWAHNPPKEHIYVFKKGFSRIKYASVHVRDAMCRKHLYGVYGSKVPGKCYEQLLFSNIDSEGSSVIENIIKDKNYDPNLTERYMLSRFLFASIFRTPWDLKKITSIVHDSSKDDAELYKGIDFGTIAFIPDEIKDRFAAGDLQFIHDNVALSAIALELMSSIKIKQLSNMIWRVYRLTEQDANFITGDHIMALMSDGPNKRLHIAPLSPKICIAMAMHPSLLPENYNQKHFSRDVNYAIWCQSVSQVIGMPDYPYIRSKSPRLGSMR